MFIFYFRKKNWVNKFKQKFSQETMFNQFKPQMFFLF